MGSRKEEERNEKIIRGLMKLPPNRRCINCNSLGPQYVCTNFWTFVCMTCSGIHREFTHRVKSVSMSKFTSPEVDALQNGGNQRAREIYLKNWDFQTQRLPDNSNVDKIRVFIRNVYVDRRYAAAKSSDKPPRDMQNSRIHEDDTRRASSYHSYSQSPPYDYQYEDRRYGKQVAALTRKPGSDKVRYEGKISSIIYSPGRFSDHAYDDDRFANEGSGPRISDFSVSNGGDQFRSDIRHSGARSSEDVWSHALNTSLERNSKRDANGIHQPQRTTSLGSTDSNLSSLRSYNSVGLVDFFSEPVQDSGSLQNSVQQPAGLGNSVSSDLSKAPVAPEPFYLSASSVDLFQLPAAPSQATSVDLFQSSVFSAVPSINESQPTQTSQVSSVDFFMDLSQQASAATSNEKSLESSVPKNEGWAIFDTPQTTTSSAQVEIPAALPSTANSLQERFDPFSNSNANMQWPATSITQVEILAALPSTADSSLERFDPLPNSNANMQLPKTSIVQVEIPVALPSTNDSLQERFNPFSNSNANMQWPSFETSSINVPSSTTSNLWHDGVWNGEEPVSLAATNTQEPIKGGIQDFAPVGGFDKQDLSSHFVSGSPQPPSAFPQMGEVQPNEISHKSTNPFDYLDDSDLEHNSMCQLQFLDISSLKAALPDSQSPPTFHSGIAESWLPQNTVNPYIPSAGQGGLTFMAAQPPSSQIPNVQTLGPVASVGGNPFA